MSVKHYFIPEYRVISHKPPGLLNDLEYCTEDKCFYTNLSNSTRYYTIW